MFAISPRKSRAHNQQPSLGARRLAIQQLEARLTLSVMPLAAGHVASSPYENTLAGGFVKIGVIQMSRPQANGVVRLGVFDGTMIRALNAHEYGLTNEPSGIIVLDRAFDLTGIRGNVLFGGTDLKFELKPIPLPEPFPTDPAGGPIVIDTRLPIAATPMLPISAEPVDSEVQQADAHPSLPVNEMAIEEFGQAWENRAAPDFLVSPPDTDGVVPSRSRAVSFHMATVAPPTTIGMSGETMPLDHAGHRHVEVAQHATSRIVANQDSPSRLEQTVPARAVEISLTKQDVEEFDAQEFTPSANQPFVGHVAQPLTKPNETAPAGKTSTRHSARPFDVDELEQEAREHVFADWRNRDLISVPAVVALVAGPLWIRHRRLQGEATELHPPKRRVARRSTR